MPTIKDVKITKPTEAQIAECSKWPIWTHAGDEFDWHYTETEKCLIIEGKVTVYSPDKTQSVSFGKGDYVVFPTDLACIWKITEPVKKYYDFE